MWREFWVLCGNLPHNENLAVHKIRNFLHILEWTFNVYAMFETETENAVFQIGLFTKEKS
jgi:hypothetical protein